jgi:MFS family permease
MEKPRLWTKDFIIISSTNFFVHVVFYLLMATVAIYVMSEYQASSGMAGLTVGIFVISALLARVFAGKYLDRIGRKRALIGSFVVVVVSMLLHFGANSLISLFIIRFIQGAAHGFLTTAAGAVAADIIPDERRGEGTGYYATSMNLAMAIGPFLGIYISSHADFQMIILVGSIIAIIGFVSTLFLQVPKVEHSEEQVHKINGFSVSDYIELKAIPISVLLFLVTFAYSSLLAFLSLYAEDIQLIEVSSFFFIVYAASLIVSRPITGKWFDKYGENRVTYPLLMCMAIGLFLLSQAHNSFIFLLSAVFIGIGYGTVQSNFLAIAIKQSPSNRTALATSTFFIFLDLGSGLGPYLLGILVGMMSFRQLYLATGIWILACIGIYYLVHGKKAAANRKGIVHRSA